MNIQGRRRSTNVIDLRGFDSILSAVGKRYGVRGGGLEGPTAAQQAKMIREKEEKIYAETEALRKHVEAEVARKTVEDGVTRNAQKRQAEIAREKQFDAARTAYQHRAREQKRAVEKLRAEIAAAQKRAAQQLAARLALPSHNPGRRGGR